MKFVGMSLTLSKFSHYLLKIFVKTSKFVKILMKLWKKFINFWGNLEMNFSKSLLRFQKKFLWNSEKQFNEILDIIYEKYKKI